ncbi:heparinase II/III family protein [Enterococcus massiliensis]|uniref:heparinase II/III family protein n=1 Tax=Enterococcus massiliensis TaxID=1640685 RepID=UPI00065E6A6A|nr:heparinase II/III family protein [Enterococcus massiliensis]
MGNKFNAKRNISHKLFDEEKMKEQVDVFIDTWKDDPKWLSGWRHHYFCDEDGSYLIYDAHSPERHVCPTCGKTYTDEKKKAAWVTIMRNKTISMLRYATIVFLKTEDEKYLKFVRQVILFYAQHYGEFQIHIKNKILPNMDEYDRVQRDIKEKKIYFDPQKTDWNFGDYEINFQGPGKIMAQGLSEAVALIRILFCYSIVDSYFTENEKQQIKEKLLIPAIEFLKKQQFIEHNITLWREVAIQVMELTLDKFKSENLSKPYGIYEHLENGLTRDGFWYEGSIHYHHYVLEALGYLSYFLTKYNEQNQLLEDKVEKMMTFSFNIAFRNGVFPNPNDGWPNVNLKTYLNVFELIASSYPENLAIQQYFQNIVALPIIRKPLPIEDETYFGDYSTIGLLTLDEQTNLPAIAKKETKHFADSQLSVLRNDKYEVFLKYGVNSLSHAHFDSFNLEFTVKDKLLSKDLSNVGYGSNLVHKWYNTPLGHNSVIVNEQNNNILYHSEILAKAPHRLKVYSGDIYPNSKISKEIVLVKKEMISRTEVELEEEGTIDVVQHLDTPLLTIPSEFTFVRNRHIDIYKGRLDESVVRSSLYKANCQEFTVMEPETEAKIIFSTDEPCELFLLDTVGNPSSENRFSLIFRFKDKKKINLNMTISL